MYNKNVTIKQQTTMKRSNWKIFINYGSASELKQIDSLTFKTKKEAHDYAKEHGYPQKCVVTEETWNEWKSSKEFVILKG